MTSPPRLSTALALLTMCASLSLHAQQGFHVQAGLGAGLLFPTSSFASIDGIPNPGDIEFSSTATPISPQFYVGGDMPVSTNWRVGGLLGVGGFSMTHEAFEQTKIAGENGEVVDATMRHNLSMQWISVSIEPYIRYQPLEFFALHLGLPLQLPFGSDYTQTLTFTDPPGTEFVDGSSTITTGSGSISSMSSFVPSVALRAEGMISVDEKSKWTLTPWIGAMSTITSWMGGSGVSTVRASIGVGIRHDATVVEPHRDTTTIRDTVRLLSKDVDTETVVLGSSSVEEFDDGDTIRVVVTERYREFIPQPPAVFIASLSVAFDGRRGDQSAAAATFEHQEQKTYLPIVPVVRFTRSETTLPDRYKRRTPNELRSWNENDLRRDNENHYHYDVLNIVGLRLKRESGDIVLDVIQPLGIDNNASAGQVREVTRYLTDVVGIDARRIKRGNVSNTTTSYTDVVIGTQRNTAMVPLILTDTVTIRTVPNLLIRPQVISEVGVRDWVITITHGDDTVGVLSDTGKISNEIAFDASGYITREEVGGSEIEVQLQATDNDGTRTKTEKVGVHVRGVSNTAPATLNSRVVSIVRVPSATVNQATSGGFVPLTNNDPLPMNMELLGPERSLYKGVEMYINKKRQR